MLLNRKRELHYLDTRHANRRAELVVLYGRRRVGKTSLVYHWVQGKPHLFFFATRDDSATLLQRFSLQIEEAAGRTPDSTFSYPNWESALRALTEAARQISETRQDRLVIVIDEFPRIVAAYPPIASYLQMVWDMELQHTNIFLILTGSLLSVMDQQILAHDAPLYLRYTWPYKLKPLTVADLSAFFPAYDANALIETYGILGGIPYNLISVDPERDLLTNVRNTILEPTGSLFNEVPLQLHLDMRGMDVPLYMRILRAIAQGAHTPSAIGQSAGLEGKNMNHYLQVLQELELVTARQPLERSPTTQKRWARYHLQDPFLRFWQRYVGPRQAELEIGHAQEALWHQIRLDMSQIVAPIWEQIAQWHLLDHADRGNLPTVSECGTWWNAKAQIDAVGVDRTNKVVIFGEARWRHEAFSQKDLDRLIERGFQWLLGTDSHWDVHHVIYARNVAPGVEDLAKQERTIHLFMPKDVVKT
ncbi:MAG: ATP-binding protein [Chloroflexota bacterium]